MDGWIKVIIVSAIVGLPLLLVGAVELVCWLSERAEKRRIQTLWQGLDIDWPALSQALENLSKPELAVAYREPGIILYEKMLHTLKPTANSGRYGFFYQQSARANSGYRRTSSFTNRLVGKTKGMSSTPPPPN